MNPPFGAQKSNQKADRKFLEKAFEISSGYLFTSSQKNNLFFGKNDQCIRRRNHLSKRLCLPD